MFFLRFGERLSFERFGLKVVLWSRGLGPAVPRSLGPVLPRSRGLLVLCLLGPVLLRSRGFPTFCYVVFGRSGFSGLPVFAPVGRLATRSLFHWSSGSQVL